MTVSPIAAEATDPQWMRYVLGRYPTGVALVSADNGPDERLAMVVGTFTSISLDPPLVGFFADRKSTTWPQLRDVGSFAVSILNVDHEDACGRIARKLPDRFRDLCWTEPAIGHPKVSDAAAWFDCEIERCLEIGDHDLVVARITNLGTGDSPSMPLVFLRGGYATPKLPEIESERPGLGTLLHVADQIQPIVDAAAAELGLLCLVSAAVEGSVVVLRTADGSHGLINRAERVGTSVPLAAPFCPLLVAWGSDSDKNRWIQRAADLLTLVTADRNPNRLNQEPLLAELEFARQQGYAVTTGREMSQSVQDVLANGVSPAALAGVIDRLTAHSPDAPATLADARDITGLNVPVFGPDGAVSLLLTVTGFEQHVCAPTAEKCLEVLASAARVATATIGGRMPEPLRAPASYEGPGA